ncbi:MAG: hypothetical protein Q6L68_06540, partial [Thermostichus sp. DG02_5_bins_236]
MLTTSLNTSHKETDNFLAICVNLVMSNLVSPNAHPGTMCIALGSVASKIRVSLVVSGLFALINQP